MIDRFSEHKCSIVDSARVYALANSDSIHSGKDMCNFQVSLSEESPPSLSINIDKRLRLCNAKKTWGDNPFLF